KTRCFKLSLGLRVREELTLMFKKIVMAVSFLAASVSFAQQPTATSLPNALPKPVPGQAAKPQPVVIPQAPQLAASGYILVDATTGSIIAEHNADERLPPASLTKMMSSY